MVGIPRGGRGGKMYGGVGGGSRHKGIVVAVIGIEG